MCAFSTFAFFVEPFWVPVCVFDMLDDVERDREKRSVPSVGIWGRRKGSRHAGHTTLLIFWWLAIDNRQSGIR